jgi:hypothetical protein
MERFSAKRALLRLAAAGEPDEAEHRPSYRVEYWVAGRVEVLAHVQSAVKHPAELDRFVARLQSEGTRAGRVVLVEETTGRVVAQHALSRPVRAWHRSVVGGKPRPAQRRLGVAPPPPASGNHGRDRNGV